MTPHKFVVHVMLKPGVLDVQGQAVEGVLSREGFAVESVRVGRRVEVTVSAQSAPDGRVLVDRMAQSFLANPVLEQYVIEDLPVPEGP